jgi:DNA primase
MNTVDDAAFAANVALVREKVLCVDLAEYETELRAYGEEWLGLCPLPDHEENTPSFYCYASEDDSRTSWYCFGCNRGGDVIDLYMAMEEQPNMLFAMQGLADRFGLKLHKPDEFMSDNQHQIAKAKREAQKRLTDAMAALVFSEWVVPLIQEIEDPYEKAAVMRACLDAAGLEKLGRDGH